MHPNTVVPPPPPRRRVARWYLIFLAIFSAGTLGISVAVGLFLAYVGGLPPIERLENYDPPEVSIVYDREGNHLAQFSSERRQVVPIERVPQSLIQAFLAIEDARYYEHFGIDLRALARSVVANRLAGRTVQGGSTITMQLPRNILETVGREKTIERKIKEALLALQIERRYSKDQILEFYLNQIFLGHHSFGVRAAAETYFSKTLEELTLAECAILAGIPRAPSIYNPLSDPDRCIKRRDVVLGRMRDLGWIGREDYEAAVATPLQPRPTRYRPNVVQSEFPYFVDGLVRELTGPYGISQEELRTQGLMITSTLDPLMQKIAEEELVKGLARAEQMWNEKKPARYWSEISDNPGPPRSGQIRLAKITGLYPDRVELEHQNYRGSAPRPAHLPYFDPDATLRVGRYLDVKFTSVDNRRGAFQAEFADTAHIQGSIVILDAHTGATLASAGGASFNDPHNRGQYNRAILGGRPTGSTIKPFFYAAALQMGRQPNDVVFDEPVLYPNRPEDYKPRNYENRFFGPTTLIEGLQHSRNIVTVRLFESLGMRRGLEQVVRFDPSPGDARWRGRLRPELPVSLGSADMSPHELAGAYLAFVRGGVGHAPHWFTTIFDQYGSIVRAPQFHEQIVIDPIVAYQAVYMMRMVVERGSGRRAIGDIFPNPPFPPIAGKTGTTNNNTDGWFAGFTPDLVIIAHVAFDTLRPMGDQMTGSRVAAPIWAETFRRIYESRSGWKMSFDVPRGIERANICAATGKRVSEICRIYSHSTYAGVPFAAKEAPAVECDGVPRPYLIPRASFEKGWARPDLEARGMPMDPAAPPAVTL
jgi:penicillin-binding protein 1A